MRCYGVISWWSLFRDEFNYLKTMICNVYWLGLGGWQRIVSEKQLGGNYRWLIFK